MGIGGLLFLLRIVLYILKYYFDAIIILFYSFIMQYNFPSICRLVPVPVNMYGHVVGRRVHGHGC